MIPRKYLSPGRCVRVISPDYNNAYRDCRSEGYNATVVCVTEEGLVRIELDNGTLNEVYPHELFTIKISEWKMCNLSYEDSVEKRLRLELKHLAQFLPEELKTFAKTILTEDEVTFVWEDIFDDGDCPEHFTYDYEVEEMFGLRRQTFGYTGEVTYKRDTDFYARRETDFHKREDILLLAMIVYHLSTQSWQTDGAWSLKSTRGEYFDPGGNVSKRYRFVEYKK